MKFKILIALIIITVMFSSYPPVPVYAQSGGGYTCGKWSFSDASGRLGGWWFTPWPFDGKEQSWVMRNVPSGWGMNMNGAYTRIWHPTLDSSYSLGPLVVDIGSFDVVSSCDQNDNQTGNQNDNQTGSQNNDAREIRFNINQYLIKSLKVVGNNQYGQISHWESPLYEEGQPLIQTDGYWWVGTVALEFDISGVGVRRCMIDSLAKPSGSSFTPVTYTMGEGCSGDSGNSDNNDKFVGQLYDAINIDDSMGISGAVINANDKISCLKELATGFASPLQVFKVTTACGGVALDQINDIFGKYNKTVEMENEIKSEMRGSIDLNVYCSNKYGSDVYAVMGDRWDAYSWSCRRNTQYVGNLDMGEACRQQHPDLPIAIMGDRKDAYSWYCSKN